MIHAAVKRDGMDLHRWNQHLNLFNQEGRQPKACPQSADYLPYISQGKTGNQLAQDQGARGKMIHKRTTHYTSIWFEHILFQSCKPSFVYAIVFHI